MCAPTSNTMTSVTCGAAAGGAADETAVIMAPTTNDAASTIEVFKVVSHLMPEWAVLIKPYLN
jgi:hypothetical protein